MEGINLSRSKKKLNSQDDSVYYRYFILFHYIFFKTIGLLPWTMETSGIFRGNREVENRNFDCYFSYLGSCYSILTFVVYVSFDILVVLNISLTEIGLNPSLDLISIKLSFITIMCTSLVILIYIFRQKLLISVNKRSKSVDQQLSKCADYQLEINNSNYLIFAVNSVLIISSIITRQIHYKSFILVLTVGFPYFIGSWVIIQYSFLLNMIRTRFKSINLTLSKLGTSESKISLSRESVIDDIDVIKRAYVELCGMCEDIGDFYGLPILIIIISLCVRSILNLYNTILVLINIQKAGTIMYQYGISLSRIIFLFMVMTSFITEIMKQIKKTARIINLLIDRYSADEKIRKKLEKFSRDLWHLTIDFTACDIIPLDRTLLAIVNIVTTFKVIMLTISNKKNSNSDTAKLTLRSDTLTE
ncbi:uncharacterized protein LOC130665213 [Microplitis mediator]|uniref:uncharacterized protein LOC130665213 n=1 Tax=Microplitis mediator TaxID=375433 RepID=UPI0025544185|nr:uncharacterized protein LOC130665213 [Microplitis mediator]